MNRNQFPIDFANYLNSQEEVEILESGTHWLENEKAKWDIVHIHWPESLIKGKKKNDDTLNWLNNKLSFLSKSAKIIATINNIEHHFSNSIFWDKLYKVVYENCDGFVHMGKPSVNLLAEKYGNHFSEKKYTIIPHGNYETLGLGVDKKHARIKIKAKIANNIFLVIGHLRHHKEVSLMVKSFKTLEYKKNQLFFVGRLPSLRLILYESGVILFFKYLILNAFWILNMSLTRNIKFKLGVIENKDLVLFSSAADVVFIPRKKTLNSGIVALGFTYSNIVVGPDYGNISEMLKTTNNLLFDIQADFRNVGTTLNKSIHLINTKQGILNYNYSHQTWNWNFLIKSYLNFYKKIIG